MLMLFLLHVFSLCCLCEYEYAHAGICPESILIHIGILMEFCLIVELLDSILCVAVISILQIPIQQLKTSILLTD